MSKIRDEHVFISVVVVISHADALSPAHFAEPPLFGDVLKIQTAYVSIEVAG